MQYILSFSDLQFLELIKDIAINEVLLQTRAFCNRGLIEDDQILSCLNELKKNSRRLILNWDILCSDRSIKNLEGLFVEIQPYIDAVRIRDPGLFMKISQEFPELPLQFSMEGNCFNIDSVCAWIDYFPQRLDRVILSNQIPIFEISQWRLEIGVNIEIQGYGLIDVFRSARRLLKSSELGDEGFYKTILTSQERTRNEFVAIQNRYGTTVQLEKELFLLDRLQEIESCGVDYVRLDINDYIEYSILSEAFPDGNWIERLRLIAAKGHTAGFFHGNNSDVDFIKLTNKIFQNESKYCFGKVIEATKQKYILIQTTQTVTLPSTLEFLTPSGRRIEFSLTKLKDINGACFFHQAPAGFYLLPWLKYAVPSTIIQLI